MAQRFKITNIERVRSQIRRETLNEVNRSIRYNFVKEAEPGLIDILLYEFGRHDTIQGILGEFPGDEDKDLQAIFGLTDDLAREIVDDIFSVLVSSLKLDFKIFYRRNTIVYNFYFYYEDLAEKIRTIPSASYTYSSNKSTFLTGGIQVTSSFTGRIPWLDWLLDGASTEASLEFDPDLAASGRSKRAIMRGGGGWHWMGQNFILEAFSNPIFLDKIERYIDRFLNKRIKELIEAL